MLTSVLWKKKDFKHMEKVLTLFTFFAMGQLSTFSRFYGCNESAFFRNINCTPGPQAITSVCTEKGWNPLTLPLWSACKISKASLTANQWIIQTQWFPSLPMLPKPCDLAWPTTLHSPTDQRHVRQLRYIITFTICHWNPHLHTKNILQLIDHFSKTYTLNRIAIAISECHFLHSIHLIIQVVLYL